MTPTSASMRRFLPPAIGLATFLAFLPALSGEFLNWDDGVNFLENPFYRGLAPANLRWMATTFLMGHYHPLTWLTLGLDYALWGMNPLGYHLTSLLFHAVNAVLLYLVLRRLLGLCGRPDAAWPAAAGALLYSLHPLRVESVAWITERRDVVCVFFALLSVLAWLKRVEEERAGRPGGKWLALSIAAFAASLLSKALSITLPGVLFILDVHLLRRTAAVGWKRVLLEKLPYLILCCADLAIMLAAMRSIEAVHEVASYAPLERLAQAAYGLCFYPLKTLWPSGLMPMYRIDKPLNPWALKYVLSMVGAVAGFGVLVAFRRRRPEALAAALSYALLVLPVLGVAVTGMQIAADRYTTLALIPASALAAAGLAVVDLRRAAPPLLALLLLLGGLTWRQAGYWKDSITLWNRQIELDPEADLAYRNRGSARHLLGDAQGALQDYDLCLRLRPDQPNVLADRGSTKVDLGDRAGGIADLDRAIELNPRLAKAYNLRGLARDRIGDVAGARADYDRCLQENPSHVLALANRGFLRRKQGDLDGALSDAEAAIRMDPTSGAPYVLRASIRRKRGDGSGALADLDEAVRRSPTLLEAYNNRAMIYLESRQPGDAVKDYDRALTLKPDNPPVLVGRAQARLALNDRAGAARDLARALEISPPNWPLRGEVEKLFRSLTGPPELKTHEQHP